MRARAESLKNSGYARDRARERDAARKDGATRRTIVTRNELHGGEETRRRLAEGREPLLGDY
jgi:hypothetical protein